MREDNPMLGQLTQDYESNPHFAVLADSVAQDVLDCPFGEAMNAHADAETTEMQLIGTLKRLVCNAIFKMYAGPPGKSFDASLFARAHREMDVQHRKVQGFAYPHEGSVRHVVRDLTMALGSQEIASFIEDLSVSEESPQKAEGEYLRCHTLMMRAIHDHQMSMTWTHYLWGTTSGHFDRVEEEA